MKKLITAIILATSLSAQAQTYSQSVRIQQVCSKRGELVQQLHEMKAKYAVTAADFADKGKDVHKLAIEIFKMLDSEQPKTGHDAYMLGWASCMDRFN